MSANDLVLRISMPTRDRNQVARRAEDLKAVLQREGIRWTAIVDGEMWGEDHTDPEPEPPEFDEWGDLPPIGTHVEGCGCLAADGVAVYVDDRCEWTGDRHWRP